MLYEDDERREVLTALAQTVGDVSYWRGQWAPQKTGAVAAALSMTMHLLGDEEFDAKAFGAIVGRVCTDPPKDLDKRAKWAEACGRQLWKAVFDV